jgi:hypothetical protein
MRRVTLHLRTRQARCFSSLLEAALSTRAYSLLMLWAQHVLVLVLGLVTVRNIYVDSIVATMTFSCPPDSPASIVTSAR